MHEHQRRWHGDMPTYFLQSDPANPPPGLNASHLVETEMVGESSLTPYICAQEGCDRAFIKAAVLENHYREAHPSVVSFPCHICGCKVATFGALIGHYVGHGYVAYHCAYCSYAHQEQNVVKKHLIDFHPDDPPKCYARIPKLPHRPVLFRPLRCKHCPYSSKVTRNLLKHLLRHRRTGERAELPVACPTNPRPCDYRGDKMFDQMANLASSSGEEVSEDKRYICSLPDCVYLTLNDTMLKYHIQALHGQMITYPSYASSVRSALDLHFAAKHPSEAVNVFAIYYRLDEVDAEAAVKVEHCQPIWTRHNPRRIRHVRGILIEEVKDEQEEEREETEETKEGKETEKVKESKESPAAGCVKAEGAPHAATEDEFLSLYETKSCELGPTGDAEGKQFVCPKCTKYKTKRKMDFARHLHKELGYNRFVCGNCGHMNTNLPNMKRHHEMAHKTARLPEAIVPLTPDSAIEQWIQSVLDHQEHQIEGTAPSDQPTAEPKLEAKSEPESKAESKLEPKPEPGSVSASPADTSKTQPVYKCSYCSERGTIPVLRGHWKTLHSHLRFKVIRQARRYVCNHCDFQSAKMPGIRAHMASRHPDQPATDFQTRTHDRETRFKCGWCRERFLTRDKATSHHQVFHSHLELKLDTYAARGLPQAVGAAQAETTEPAASAEPEYQKMKRVVRGRDGPRVGSPAPSDATTGSRGTKRYSEVTTQLTLGGASAMRVNVPTLAQIVKLYPRIAVVDLRKKKLQFDGPRWLCGAVLITRWHALTAAHCVRSHTAGELVLRLGEYNLSSTTDGHHQDFAVLRSIAHPNSRRRQNDLALLRLDGTVTFSRLMQPICLPEADKTTDGNGDYLLVAGWGRLSFAGADTPVLREAPLSLVPSAQCEATYRQLPSFDDSFPDGGFNGTKLCAADPEQAGADACLGDSGGPLTVLRSDGWYELSGLVSFGVGCGDPDFPGVYTRVSSYVDWVVDMIASEKGPHTSDHAHV
ncbi:uncharacterized protein LOC119111078 [Pollicipes pollicipes]|uniref:uncharacterized protein LOC119111078 n=1 Tax=Pollicipes pollicipes TaxID=41117 RepID=UPI001884CA70|nr:uncharacterized protein LOC119111078 [Pollicipes pollicipes]